MMKKILKFHFELKFYVNQSRDLCILLNILVKNVIFYVQS